MTALNERLSEAQRLLAKGKSDAARAAALAILEEHPGILRAHLVAIDTAMSSTVLAPARQLAETAVAQFPKSPLPRLRLAKIARKEGQLDDAVRILTDAVSECPRHAGVEFEIADIQLAAADPDAAIATLRSAAEHHHDHIQVHLRLASTLINQAREAEALVPLERLLELDPGSVPGNRVYIRCLTLLGREEEVLQHAEAALAQGVTLPGFYLGPARIYQKRRDVQAETDLLSRGLQALPGNPELVTSLVSRCLTRLNKDSLARLAGGILTDKQIAKFEIDILLKQALFEEALAGLRQQARGLRDLPAAKQVAEALIWLNKGALARRYLQFCLRRWPNDWALAQLITQGFVRTFRDTDGIRLLSNTRMANPEHQALLEFRRCSMYCSQRNYDRAMECFRRARPMIGKVGMQNQEFLRSLMSAGRWDDLAEVVDALHTPGAPGTFHLRSSLLGQLATEYEIAKTSTPEMLEKPAAPVLGNLATQVLKFPRSTMAAMRLIHHWRDTEDLPLAPQVPTATAPITRNIFQYWHAPEPPEDIRRMVATWQAADGFDHTLHNRETAVRALRNEFGPRWLQAFRMAKSATEEADYLRLCMIARYGGVYADADDILAGDLAGLIDRGTGSVLHLAIYGGNVGNNFFAAAPGHPLIVMAARTVRQALLSRSNESVWQKAGPGLLTRIAARYVARQLEQQLPLDVAVLTPKQVGEAIFMHNSTSHKRMGSYWNAKKTRTADYLALLEGHMAPA